jgi:DNA invertase Pin-like site-specific DNA recombinase
MVELFDAHGVSFVSVTQQFNTTTSMGRLTLNVLLSFAQFEREVTSERIRDKIAASKRKGLWVGADVRGRAMKATPVKPVRCAIYTRVSTDQGLDQEFNSLDAQYDASSAYIKSQAHAGWTLIKARYDDGGYSGGSTDRPDLQRLLDDIRARKIDVIVVLHETRRRRKLSPKASIEDEVACGVRCRRCPWCSCLSMTPSPKASCKVLRIRGAMLPASRQWKALSGRNGCSYSPRWHRVSPASHICAIQTIPVPYSPILPRKRPARSSRGGHPVRGARHGGHCSRDDDAGT